MVGKIYYIEAEIYNDDGDLVNYAMYNKPHHDKFMILSECEEHSKELYHRKFRTSCFGGCMCDLYWNRVFNHLFDFRVKIFLLKGLSIPYIYWPVPKLLILGLKKVSINIKEVGFKTWLKDYVSSLFYKD